MEVELPEIQTFLANHPPFDKLPPETLERLPPRLAVRHLRQGSPFPPEDADQPYLYMLRRGAVELRDARGDLVGKLSEGDWWVMPCRNGAADIRLRGSTVEDALAYLLPCADLDRLRALYPAFAEYFGRPASHRAAHPPEGTLNGLATDAGLITVRVGDLLRHAPVSTSPDTPIREAARIMSEHRVSALLIMEGEHLAGIVTDRDLRNRCVAVGLPFDRPVRDIMTERARLHTVDADGLGFQALLAMIRNNVHHLPVLKAGRVAGLISTTDLTRFQSANAVYLIGAIHKADGLDTLVRLSAKIAELQVHLVSGGANLDQVGQTISAITDAISLRLLAFAEAELGPPPVPYAWMVGGSQARREQSSHSDQDNALLIADHMKPADDAYFAALASIVNDGLHACGYVYCPGEVMARNPKWRQPLRIWKKYFNTWIERPDPMALMLSSVFFDLRPLHDPENLFEELHAQVLEFSRANRIFIAYMTANALKHRPPLGIFRNIVLIHGGDHDHTLDLKHRGTVPIIDLARVYALSAGIPTINTLERLRAAAASKVLSRDGGANLIDAFEFIGTLRLRHQARQLRRGQPADNFLSLEELSSLERGHLRESFLLIHTMQESLGHRYQAGQLA